MWPGELSQALDTYVTLELRACHAELHLGSHRLLHVSLSLGLAVSALWGQSRKWGGGAGLVWPAQQGGRLFSQGFKAGVWPGTASGVRIGGMTSVC